jgi:transposase-like protein
MAIIDFKCPECKEKNNFALMGNDKGIFDRKCKACNTKLEIENNSDGIQVKSLQKNIKRKPPTRHAEEIQEREDNNVPTDYKKYKLGIPNKKTAKFIAILILTSSLMGLFTGYAIIDFFNSDFDEFENVEIEIQLQSTHLVSNNTTNLNNAQIILDGEKIVSTSVGDGTYNIVAKPGKHTIGVICPYYKSTTRDIFIPPQDSNLSLIDVERGIEGTNRFTFTMQEGEGKITLEKTTYLKMEPWFNLIFLFAFIGIWGSWVTYKLKSYNIAQIGAFCSVLAMGFLIIGPILGIIALYYLKKNKKMFTASFKN